MVVAGAPADKPSRLVGVDEPLVVLGGPPAFASRAGAKLAAALDRFGVDPAGRRALDAGASTGGFTDCLLQRGAATVVAVDVGHGQLHERLRGDPRIVLHDRTNIRTFTLAPPADLVVADLSFISLRTVAPALLGANAAPGADAVLLVKPQFEAGRIEASRGRGVIKDPAVWLRALEDVAAALAGTGAAMMGAMVSPVAGTDGNVEFLFHARAHASGATGPVGIDLADLAASARAGRDGG